MYINLLKFFIFILNIMFIIFLLDNNFFIEKTYLFPCYKFSVILNVFLRLSHIS